MLLGEKSVESARPRAPGDLRSTGLELFCASLLVLFQELALIRWLGSQVRVVAYFPNLVLMSAFLGVGIGCLWGARARLARAWAPLLMVIVLAALGLGQLIFTSEGGGEHLWLLYYDLPKHAPVLPFVAPPVLLVFVLTAASFVPLGQAVGERLRAFELASRSLTGYAWDLGGSLAGVVLFSAFSFVGVPPVGWMALIVALGALLFLRRERAAAVFATSALVVLLGVALGERADVYSPYYALSTNEIGHGNQSILANGSLHQVATNMDVAEEPNGLVRDGYQQPYRLLARPPKRVLVVGAGTGNDVVTALRQGAARVDAVEIDPQIVELGRRLHPNHPYRDPRVRVHLTDARSFLDRGSERFDLIVFGTLDSMTRLSALSNVRLDNFVYTRESLLAAKARLAPHGGLVLYFMVGEGFIDRRLSGLLTDVFGQAPLVDTTFRRLFNRVYAAGPAFEHHHGAQRRASAARLAPTLEAMLLPSDDWPFLYLERRSLSPFYLRMIAAVLVLSLLGVFGAARASGTRLLDAPDWPLFFFGAGFLLLETRAVTVMGLSWGSTWLTNAVVFSSILALTLLGVLIGRVRMPDWRLALAGVLLSLGAIHLLPESLLATRELGAKLLVSSLYVGAPVLFASFAFSSLYAARRDVATAFGWNLLGAMLGGLTEFLCMALGLKALVLLAMLFYALAALFELRRRDAGSTNAVD